MRLAFAATVLFAVALGGWWDVSPVLVGLAYAGVLLVDAVRTVLVL